MYPFLLAMQCAGIFILVLEILCVLYRRSTKLQVILLMVLVSTLTNFAGYLLEMQATTKEMALQAVKIIYLGKPFIIFFIFIFYLERMEIKVPKLLYPALGILHIAVSILVFTCEHHVLFYSSIDYDTTSGIFPHLVFGHGAFYWIYHAVVLSYVVFMLVTSIISYRRSDSRQERIQIVFLDVISTASVIGLLVFFSGISGGYDTTMIGYLVSTLLLLVLITRYDILDTLSMVKEIVLDEFSEGLLVINQDGKMVYANTRVHTIFPELEDGNPEHVVRQLSHLCKNDEKLFFGKNVYRIYEEAIVEENRLYGQMFVVQDVTESYNHAVELEEQTQIARDANQAKSDFLARMSHEIRTPINAILGMNELILRESTEEAIRNYAVDGRNSANALLGVVNDILDTTRIESGKMELTPGPYELDSLLNDLISIIYAKAESKGLGLEVEVDSALPNGLVGDEIRIRQILINLLNNSVKYTHEGKVSLYVTGNRDGDMLLMHFEVRDTGIGIKEEDLPKLFAAFERIEESRNRNIEGTGLGMNIVIQLLKLMGTKLDVASTYGEGSVFSFDLRQEICDDKPIGNLEERSRKLHQVEAYRPEFIAPQARILVADDNEINRKVFCGLLKGTEVRIDEVDSGFACIERVKQHSYDAIFMDHMMPDLDGVETFRRMCGMEHKCKETPVIILTANAVTGAREQYLKEGFADYLTKPISGQELEEALWEYLPEDKVEKNQKPQAEEAAEALLYDTLGTGSRTKYHMLVVDDDSTNRMAAQNILKNYCQVHLADSGEKALELMMRRRPDIVLLDINMPGMDGFQVIEKMKSSVGLQEIPVIFVTAEQSGAVESRCFAAGAEDYVVKPFTPEVLISRVQKILDLKNYQVSLETMVEEQSEELLRKMTEINVMQREMINSMANLIESRDESTGNHVKRTSDYVRRIVDILKLEHVYEDFLTKDYTANLFDAAPMHDIGKIRIPDRILQKPSGLTDEEFETMKTHTIEGGGVIRDVFADIESEEYIEIACDVAVSHHEKWDGTGYPHGKAGEDIPLAARIMALADVFDALVSERYYKKGMTAEEAFSIIEESSGKQFDPQIAEAVLAHRDYFAYGGELPAETDNAEDPAQLPKLEGFDWDYARQYHVDEGMLRGTIRNVYQAIDPNIEKLQGWFGELTAEDGHGAKEALEDYRILVHAIKGNMLMIGAVPLSNLAKALEEAAAEQDLSRLRQMHPEFMEEMRAHQQRLEDVV